MPPTSYHFSVDDALESLLEVSDRRQSLLEHPFFGFLNQLHMRYDAHIDLYLFSQLSPERGCRGLEHISSSLRNCFDNCPWLRLGPHGLDDATPPHTQSISEQLAFFEAAYAEIARFAGHDRLCEWMRLHYFSECYELASYLRSHRVSALLTTDKPAICYRLPSEAREGLQKHGRTDFNGIHFVRSHVRVENLAGRSLSDLQLFDELDRLCANTTCAVVFTHEYELIRPEVREMTFRVFDWFRHRQLVPQRTLTELDRMASDSFAERSQ